MLRSNLIREVLIEMSDIFDELTNDETNSKSYLDSYERPEWANPCFYL